jgi:dTDP-4-amino-4,6-dideoxygalactose transaminase
MPVHLYGHPVDMQPVLDFARVRGLRVIEDASQAHGATYRGERVGSMGISAASVSISVKTWEPMAKPACV